MYLSSKQETSEPDKGMKSIVISSPWWCRWRAQGKCGRMSTWCAHGVLFPKGITFLAYVRRCFHKTLTWIYLSLPFVGGSCSVWNMLVSLKCFCWKPHAFEKWHELDSIFEFSWQLPHFLEHGVSKLLLKHVIARDDLTSATWCQVTAYGSSVKGGRLASWRQSRDTDLKLTCITKHPPYDEKQKEPDLQGVLI